MFVTAAVEQLVREVSVQALIVMNGAPAKVVEPHGERDKYEARVDRPFDSERDFQTGAGLNFT